MWTIRRMQTHFSYYIMVSDRFLILTHLLDVLQWDLVLPKLLVDEDEGVEVAHPPIEELIWQPPRPLHHSLVILQQSEKGVQGKKKLTTFTSQNDL